jgi:hypothetical protein
VDLSVNLQMLRLNISFINVISFLDATLLV